MEPFGSLFAAVERCHSVKVIDLSGVLVLLCASCLSASCRPEAEELIGDDDGAADASRAGEVDAPGADVSASTPDGTVPGADASTDDAVRADVSSDVASSADADGSGEALDASDGFDSSADHSTIDVSLDGAVSADADGSAPPGPIDASGREAPLDVPPTIPCMSALDAALNVQSVIRGTGDIVTRIVDTTQAPVLDCTVTIEGERLSSCGSNSVLLPAHLFQNASSVRGTINRGGACANIEIAVVESVSDGGPGAVALATLDSISPNTVPIDMTTKLTCAGANLGVRPAGYDPTPIPAIVIGKDCAHERLYTGMRDFSTGGFTVNFNPPEVGSYYAYGIRDIGDSVATSHRLPITITGVNPAPAIESFDPTVVTLASEMLGGPQVTLTSPTAFTSGMRIVGEKDGVIVPLPFCDRYAKTCAPFISRDLLQTPGDLHLRVQAYDGTESNPITVRVAVATPVLDAIKPVQLTRRQTGTLLATGTGFTFGAAPDHRSRLRDITHGIDVDFASVFAFSSTYVQLNLTPALTDTLGNSSFQIVNPDGATPRQSGVVNVSVLAGPWLSNNDSQTIHSTNPVLVLHGTGLDTPPQGGQPFAHFVGALAACPVTYDLAPTSIAESQWSLAIPQTFFTCAAPNLPYYSITVNIPGAPVSNESPNYYFAP